MKNRRSLWVFLVLLMCSVAYLPAMPEDGAGEAKFLKNTRQLIYDGRRSGEGYFSVDGNYLVFQSEREEGNPFFQMYVMDLTTGDVNRISTGKGKTTCAFFRPGHDELEFASTHLDPDALKKQKEELELRAAGKARRYTWDYDTTMDIFTTDLKGGHVRRLTTAVGYDAEGSYSPDGSKIVFCSLRSAYPLDKLSAKERESVKINPSNFGEIYIMDADGSNQTRLTNWPGYDGGPFFTPDGQRIVWRHFDESGTLADVYTMRLDGSDVRRLTDFKCMSWAPFFHPSGDYVIFASNKLGFANFELFMTDKLGRHEPVRVTYTEGFDGLPVFSPVGKKLCWTSTRTADKKSQLFIANWDHEAALAAIAASPLRNSENSTFPKTNQNSDVPDGASTTNYDDRMEQMELSSDITVNDLKQEEEFLASDKLEGRLTGSEGAKSAAAYIANILKKYDIKPIGDTGSYLQKFDYTAGLRLREGQNQLRITSGGKTQSYKVNEDFRPLPFTENGEIEGEIVFAGYGLSIPGKAGDAADSYGDLDVKDKIVLVLRYVPEDVSVERRQKLNLYAGLRYKALIAREHGAKGLLVITGPNSPKAGALVPLKYDQSGASSGIVAASVSDKIAEKLFALAGKNLKDVQSQLDTENPHFEGTFSLPDVKVKLAAGVDRIKKNDNNVVGILGATNGNNSETILVGAHYDHLGHGEIGSLAGKGEEGEIHNGADDNASGTSVVLELAAFLRSAQKQNPDIFTKNIVFAFWSGEEMGIIGSSYFADHSPVKMSNIVAYLNFDMVGRLNDNKLILQGVASSSQWKKIIERRNVVSGFNITLQDDPYQPTDVTAFYPKGVPVMSFFTGAHEDYHRPSDDVDKLNYEGMVRIAKFANLIIRDLMNSEQRPDYVKVARSKSGSGSRESMRAYLGTIPDYVTEGSGGVKLTGVSGGGPADKAGLKSGDVIIELAGQKITNIYDYTYAIDALKIGKPTKVVVLREGKELALNITPETRE